MKPRAYVYDLDTRRVVRVIVGSQRGIDAYASQVDTDLVGVTQSPAWGTVDGLVNSDAPVIAVDDLGVEVPAMSDADAAHLDAVRERVMEMELDLAAEGAMVPQSVRRGRQEVVWMVDDHASPPRYRVMVPGVTGPQPLMSCPAAVRLRVRLADLDLLADRVRSASYAVRVAMGTT